MSSCRGLWQLVRGVMARSAAASPVAIVENAAVSSSPSKALPTRNYRKGLHPRLFDVRVVASDGSTFTIRSPQKQETVKLTEDMFNLYPWVGEAGKVDTSGQVSKFSERFSSATIDTFKLPGAKN